MKLHNAVVGFILGDMFGVPYEFMSNPSPVKKQFVGYRTHNQPPYTWSDDTAFLLATYFHKDKHPEKLKEEYKKVLEGKYFQKQVCFDVGYSTKSSLVNGKPPTLQEGGNGFIGRCIPYLFREQFNTLVILNNIYLTHNSNINILAGLWYLETLHRLLKGEKIQNIAVEYENFFSVTEGKTLLNGAEICEVTKKNMSAANFFSEFCKSLVARSAERSEGTRARRDVISAPLPRSAERSEALRGNNTFTAIGAVNVAFKTFEESTSLLGGFQSICRKGGDTDSVCALFGALWGANKPISSRLIKLVEKEVEKLTT